MRARHDLSSLRKILHAAAPCPPEVKRRVMAVFPPGVVWEFYGATEGPGTIISPEEWLARPGSVGRPWPGITVKVLDDDGHDVPPGTVGTIYLSTPGGGKFSYRNAPEKTASAFRGDFFTVGDMGWLDADGYLFIADRRTDMVITGGVNVYPAEIEAALLAHPDIVDAAVFGVPDDRWGEALRAVVEPRRGAVLSPEIVQGWCRATPRRLQDASGGRAGCRAPPRPERQGAEARAARPALGRPRASRLAQRCSSRSALRSSSSSSVSNEIVWNAFSRDGISETGHSSAISPAWLGGCAGGGGPSV